MRDFFKQTFATLLALFIFAGISVGGLLLLVIGVAVSSSQDSTPQVKNKSVLTIDMTHPITDTNPDAGPLELIQNPALGNVVALRSAVKAIEAAADDDRIVGIYLTNRNTALKSGSGYANLKEVREALETFKQSGKKIYAYDVDWQEREYYLASVADQISINPMGSLELNGLSSETTFYGAALQKFGVGVQAIWRGKYKSAVEPWLRSNRTPASREQTEKLLNDIWQEFLQDTSQARKLPIATVKQLANTKGYMTAEEAKQAKMFDRVAYADEMIDELKKLTGEDTVTKSFQQISLKNYAEAVADKINSSDGSKIAVVYAEGEIVNGQGTPEQIGGDRFARVLRRLRQDKEVKAVVLRVNSPGGSATASDVIQREMILTQKSKPVVVSMGGVAASGGYWISTYANKIFAEPNTITGSIGVYGLQPNFQKIANDNGINWDVVKTGKFADSLTVYRPKNKEEIAVIQRVIGQIYDQFITKVAQSRQLDPKKVQEIAQGRVWSGLTAKELGLVDELGGLEAAITEAAKIANLGDDWHVAEYPEATTLEERIFRGFLENAQAKGWINQPEQTQDIFSDEIQKFQTDLNSLRVMNDPRGIYMRLPENLHIR
jgi:protease IV